MSSPNCPRAWLPSKTETVVGGLFSGIRAKKRYFTIGEVSASDAAIYKASTEELYGF